MRKKYDYLYVRLTEEQVAALDKAKEQHQRRTGRHLITSEIVRGALSTFCRDEGTSFPSFYEKRKTKAHARAIAR